MQTSISLNDLLEMLRPLSDSNKRWLADRLYEEVDGAKRPSTETISEDTAAKVARLRGIAKDITPRQIAEDDRLAYILGK